jgi:hypothetical protein
MSWLSIDMFPPLLVGRGWQTRLVRPPLPEE